MARPKRKIGLVLGAGAARGWAHIGVIRALAERGIYPDIVTGSSVGAIVGAIHASGKLSEFEQWIDRLSRFDIIRLLDPAMAGGGLLKGTVLMKALEKYLATSFAALEMPFGCVATELGSGREIWFRSGSLQQACRASISMPGLFAPAACEGQYLVDGALVNPVPISLARAMGAEIIIAVNLNGELVGQHFWVHPDELREAPPPRNEAPSGEDDKPASNGFPLAIWAGAIRDRLGVQWDSYISSLRKKETPDPGLFDVIVGSVDIMQDRITRSRMVGEPPDIHLTPRVSHIGLMDFDRAAESVEEGREAVERKAEELKFLAKTEGHSRHQKTTHTTRK